jgi:hypothetical protein
MQEDDMQHAEEGSNLTVGIAVARPCYPRAKLAPVFTIFSSLSLFAGLYSHSITARTAVYVREMSNLDRVPDRFLVKVQMHRDRGGR